MKTLLVILAATLVVAPAATAAPPANDNREDAIVLPTFPGTAHGTTAEATVERLDPQVSRCGRIEGTVWYRIEAAPDGTIVATTQASGGLAPVVRIYRRNQSNIEELDCARANAGEKAVVSLQATRGAGYLILVGRRPGTGDGEFDLRVDLHLPPANDEREDPIELGVPPASVRATTLGATYSAYDGCGISGGSVWYEVVGPASGRAIVRLDADEELHAIVGIYRPTRAGVQLVNCGRTDDDGRLLIGFAARPRAGYLVVVGEQLNSAPGGFRLGYQAAEAPERGQGRILPKRGARDSVNGATDVNDVWSMRMRRGTTYRIAYRSSPCAQASFRARKRRFSLGCGSYTTFTPGRDGGGLYRFEIAAGASAVPHRYRLLVVQSGPDDVGVGLELRRNAVKRGRLAPGGVDVRDIYHFDLERLSEVRLGLAQSAARAYRLYLLTDKGRRVEFGSNRIRRRLGRGRYVVAVEAPVGARAGSYRLALRVRVVTTTVVRMSSREIAPGSAITLSCIVSPATGGRVELQIDRFDPFTGWHFHRVIRIPAGASVSWRPPAPGRWRVRATFRGTAQAARSRSGYAQILVARPIE